MNANELADELHKIYIQEAAECWDVVEEAATMLRKQQFEIEALKGGFFDWSVFKKLTDEEILKIADASEWHKDEFAIKFARAILRKAQEK